MVKVWSALVSCPPLATPPLSTSRTVTVAEPNKFGAGVYVNVPAGLMAGTTLKRLLFVVETWNVSVWPLSSAGPVVIPVAQPLEICDPPSSGTDWSNPLTKFGASLTAVTVRPAVSTAVLKDVVPPLTVASAVAPLAPAVRSQARNERADAIVPLKLFAGTNRIRVVASAARRRAVMSATDPSGFQSVPLFVEYCHEPPVVLAAVTAMPSTAPASTSVIRSPPALAIRLVTSVPAFASSSSRIAFKVGDPELSNTGASLTALTVIVKVCGALVSWPPLAVPPLSCRRTVTVALPFAFAAGVYVSVPVADTAGNTPNNASLLVETRNVSVCPFSSAGPREIFVAQFGTVCAPASSFTV